MNSGAATFTDLLTLKGNSANAAHTHLKLQNTDSTSSGETGQTSDIEFWFTDNVGSQYKGAKISAYKDNDWVGNSDYDAGLTFSTVDNSVSFENAYTERLRIDSIGRIKIGPIASHTDATTHCLVYIEMQSDVTNIDDGEGGATTGLVRIVEKGSNDNRYHGIELRNKNSGDIRILNKDVDTSDRGDLVIVVPDDDATEGTHQKITFNSMASAIQISGKGGVTHTNGGETHTDIYIATKTGVTAVESGAGAEIAGIIRFEDKGSNDNRYHGLELRNKNAGDIRILNLDEGTINKSNLVIATDNGTNIFEALRVTSTGEVLPGADATQDLGSATKRWANIYSADLQLSNEGATNEVDGTWGNYTIQEGEDDLFLINRRSGKKYKFMLQEVT